MELSTVKALLQRPIAFHPIFAKISGSATSGLFLSQLYYWHDKGHDPDGWIYKTYEEWREETCLSRSEIDRARKSLKKLGIIEEAKVGIPCKIHYRLNLKALTLAIAQFAESDKLDCRAETPMVAQFAESNKLDRRIEKTRSQNPANIIYTETTPANSSKITNTDYAHALEAREKKEKNNLEEEKNEPQANKSTATEEQVKEEPSKKPVINLPSRKETFNNGKSSAEFEEKINAFRRDLLEYATQSKSIRSPSAWVNTILEEVRTYQDSCPWFEEWLAGKPIGSHRMNDWDVRPDEPDQEFIKYLKDELAQPNESEGQRAERAYQVLRYPDRAGMHWENYQRKIHLEERQREEEAKKQEEINQGIFPEEAPFEFVEDLLLNENLDQSFTHPIAGRIFKAGIMKAYSHADERNKRDIMIMLNNNKVTKEWAEKTLGD